MAKRNKRLRKIKSNAKVRRIERALFNVQLASMSAIFAAQINIIASAKMMAINKNGKLECDSKEVEE